LPLDLASLRQRDFRRILLIKLSAVGDVVHTIPVLHKLRRRYPSARIDWLITPAIAELLRHHPAITNVVEFDRNEWSARWQWSAFASSGRLAARLRAVDYDLVVDMHGQFRTAVFTLATGAPVRIGFDRPRPQVWEASGRTLPKEARKHAWKGAREASWLAYTHHIRVPTLDVHAVDRYLSVGPMLGLDEEAPDFSFPIPAAAAARIDRLLQEHGFGGADPRPLLTIAPGTIWETKHWRSEGFAEVSRHFMRKGFSVVLIGSGRERGACDEVATLAPGSINIAGETSLTELAAIIRRSTICLTNDSGPMHLAVALERPVVSIFGPTDSVWIGPYRRSDAVVQSGLSCAPCYLRRLSRCPHDHACMREVSALAVIERIEGTLTHGAADSQSIERLP
jgi:3-deoxy-D-manno-octulosonic-acid transferase/heptosyltransferase-1